MVRTYAARNSASHQRRVDPSLLSIEQTAVFGISIDRNRIDLPFFGAGKPMRRRSRIVGLGSKPREAHRNAAANRQALLPVGTLAKKERLFSIRRPP